MKKIILAVLFLAFALPVSAETFYKDSSGKIWAEWNGLRRLIRSEVILNSYGTSTPVSISDLTLARMRINNLVRVKGTPEVMALNDSGYARHIVNPDIFNSYQLSWEDVADVSQAEMDAYKVTNIVREASAQTVYLLEGTTIKPIKDLQTFNSLSLNWEALQIINQEDLATYTLGEELVTVGEAPEQPTVYGSPTPTPTQTPTPTPTQTPTPTPTPIVKKVSISSNSHVNSNGWYYDIRINYYENNKEKNGNVTLTSTNSGYFIGYNCLDGEDTSGSQKKGNPLTCPLLHESNPNNWFQFMLSGFETWTLTATVNGETATEVFVIN